MPNDFETVRNGLHYYGDTIPNDPEVMAESDAALDRIEAEVERAEKKWTEYWQRAKESEAEVERLRLATQPGVYEELSQYQHEVERLRAAGYEHTVHCDDADDLRAALAKEEASA